jgi:hypothetical protein
MRQSLTTWLLPAYILVVLAALVVAAVRLHESTEMPGLAAIELVLLALPWSLSLRVESLSRLGLSGMTALVLGGLVLNGILLRAVASWLHRGRLPKGTRSVAHD